MERLYEIQDIIRDVLGDETITIDQQSMAADVRGWNSLANVQIILSIEDTFGVEFSLDEMTSFHCIGDIIRTIEQKLGER